MVEPGGGFDAEWNKPVTEEQINTLWLHLHEESKIVVLIEAESRMVSARGWREEEMGSCHPNGSKVLVMQEE